jgi:UDP-N-acetylglucosamine transferase subunit ALG13
MIFVTVGTHEQPFNRLIKYIDQVVEKKIITDNVFIQTGYSDYHPKFCEYKPFIPYSQMEENVKKADIVITHGGPSSFIMPLQIGKIPIVVPRQKKYGEHVNDHQVDFARKVNEKYGNLIVIDNIDELGNTIKNYSQIVSAMKAEVLCNNKNFCEAIESIAQELVGQKNG